MLVFRDMEHLTSCILLFNHDKTDNTSFSERIHPKESVNGAFGLREFVAATCYEKTRR